ncbi:hypothetical protein SK128_022464 [Halocaridina rubra]|uniref:Reverse transcriptase domain-containing protein n=1 Tax=Halocaridina rubra TaxID=373956 RepID=A0AAN8WKQ2_HALRR
MEKLLRKHISLHLESFNFLSVRQHGFREGRSTVTNLLEFYDEYEPSSFNNISSKLRPCSHRAFLTAAATAAFNEVMIHKKRFGPRWSPR